MKILAICGSRRSGNTEAMLKRILDGAMEAGAKAELVMLRDKNIQLCGGCEKCAETKSCHVMDDMTQIYKKVFESDVLVLGSPNYFNNVSATMKNFIDRFCPYWEERLKGKKAVLALVGTEGGASLKYPEGALKQFCEICGMKIIATIKAKAEKAKEVLQNEKLMQECFETGKHIAQAKV